MEDTTVNVSEEDVTLDERNITPSSTNNRHSLEELPTEYTVDGAKLMMHGFNYQLKLLSLYLCRALMKSSPDNPNQNISTFRIATEMKAAGQFDDIVFHYQKNTARKWLFLQAKHKSNTDDNSSKIKLSDILPETIKARNRATSKGFSKREPFSLVKYFLTYRKIESNPSFEQLKEYIICTNLNFDFDDVFYYSPHKCIRVDSMFNETDDDILDNKVYTFKNDFHGRDYIVESIRNSCGIKENISQKKLKGEIDNYLKMLRFAVNQPTEEQFEKLIKSDIRTLCNVLDPEMIYSHISRCMYDWFSNKSGRFLTRSDALELFEQAENVGNKYKLVGLSMNHRKKFQKINMRFSQINYRIEEFLNCNQKQMFNLLVKDDIRFGTMKLIQQLTQLKQSSSIFDMSHQDSYIMLTAEEVIRNGNILDSAFSLKSSNLLIINYELDRSRFETFLKIINDIINRSPNNKIIIVIIDDNYALELFRSKYVSQIETQHEITQFSDLDNDSQSRILHKLVDFQGYKVKLIDLLPENTTSLIDSAILIKFIYNEPIKIGNEIEDLMHVNNYYIERNLAWNRTVNENFFKHISSIPDCVIVSNANDKDLRKYLNTNEIDNSSHAENLQVQSTNNLFSVDYSKALDEFNKLCEENLEAPVHWLNKKNDKYVWLKSRGNISHLRDFIDKSHSFKFVKTLKDIDDRVVLISAEPGMGKTTLVTQLARQTKKIESFKWIIRLNLNDCVEQLRRIKIHSVESVIEFLGEFQNFSSQFEKTLFEFSIRSSDKVAVLLDGFDEISPNYKRQVIQLLKYLQETRVEKIWVTTRLHEQKDLEDHLNVFSFFLLPFNDADQQMFLFKYWSSVLNISKKEDSRLSAYVVHLLNVTSKDLCDKDKMFTGIPLLIRLLGEGFELDLKKFYNSDKKKPNFNKKINILYLYERFVSNTFDRFLSCKVKKSGTIAAEDMHSNMWNKFIKNHKLFSLQVLFTSDQCSSLIVNKDERENLQQFILDVKDRKERTGIVYVSSDQTLHFIHRTFAEYFTSLWLEEKMVTSFDSNVLEFIKTNLFDEKYQVIRHFFDRLMIKSNKDNSQQYVLHAAVLNNKEDKVLSLLSGNKNIVHETDKLKRTALHLSAAHGYVQITKILVENGANVNKKDKLFNWTPIIFAIEAKQWSVVDFLLKFQENLNGLTKMFKDYNICLILEAAKNNYLNIAQLVISSMSFFSTVWNRRILITALEIAKSRNHLDIVNLLILTSTVWTNNSYGNDCDNLYIAAASGDIYSLRYLVSERGDVNVRNNLGWSALHISSLYGHIEIVRYLLSENAAVDIRENNHSTPLHIAAQYGQLNIVECLIKQGADIEARNNDDFTPLHMTVMENPTKSHIDVIQYLMNEGANLEARTKKYQTVLFIASEKGYIDVVKSLVVNGANISATTNHQMTPVHIAAQLGHLNVIKYYVETTKRVNFYTSEKVSLLHTAAANGQLDIVIYLLNAGAGINDATNKLVTSLHLACKNGFLAIALCLLQRGANINAVTEEQKTPLHLAIINNNLNIIKYILRNPKIDINTCQQRNETALHMAVILGHADIVSLLLQAGADINCRTDDNETPLCIAVRLGNLDIIKSLVLHRANLHSSFNENVSYLHMACSNDHFDVVKYLILKEVNINSWCASDATPLHVAVNKGYMHIVQYLIDSGADTNMLTYKNETVLHIAVNSGRFDIVNILLNKGVKVDAQMNGGLTPLHLSAQNGQLNILKCLLNKISAIDCLTNSKETPLHLAVNEGYLYIIKYLLLKGADMEAKMNENITPLHLAAKTGRLNIVKYLLKEGAIIDSVTVNGATPLYIAAENGHLEIVQNLINELADVNKQTHEKFSPLHIACQNGYFKTVKFIVEADGDINARTSKNLTPLHNAVIGGYYKIVEYLLEKGAQINVVDDENITPLHIAARDDRLDILKYLVSKGAVINARTTKLETPLYLAAHNGCSQIVRYLLDNNAIVNICTKKYRTPLHGATLNGHFEIVKMLVKKRADIGASTDENETSLHMASAVGNINILKYLINEGAAVNARTSSLKTPLHVACEHGHIDIINYLIIKQADVNAITANNETPLYIATRHGDLRTFKYLINKDVDDTVNKKEILLKVTIRHGHLNMVEHIINNGKNIINANINGETPLHIATEFHHLHIIKYLLSVGAKIDAISEESLTPLCIASINGCLDIVDYLLSKGARMDFVTNNHYMTPLHLAIQYGNINIVEYLIENGADIETTMMQNATPLHIAVHYAKLDIVKYLSTKGANVNAVTDENITPLHIAVHREYEEIMLHILTTNGNVKSRTNKNVTPLHVAAQTGNLWIVKCLITCGAEIDARTMTLSTPLYIACRYGHMNIVKYLLNERANVNIRNIKNDTPLHAATRNGHFDIVKYLINRGAEIDARSKTLVAPFYIESRDGQVDVVKFLNNNGTEIETVKNETEISFNVSGNHSAEKVRYLISKHPEKDSRSSENATPLHIATFIGHLDMVTYLLNRGADKNALMTEHCTEIKISSADNNIKIAQHLLCADDYVHFQRPEQFSPIHIATVNRHEQIITFLLDNYRDDVNFRTGTGATPLHIACQDSCIDTVSILLERGADVNIATQENLTPIHVAARYGHLHILKKLLDNGALLDVCTVANETPLHMAVISGRLNIVNYLLNSGVQIDAVTNENKSALHLASATGRFDIVKLLLSNRARFDIFTNENHNPLHIASENGHLESVRQLIESGADIDARTIENATSLHLAVSRQHYDVVEYLLCKNASINVSTNEGFTPLHIAAREGNIKILKCLLKEGADIEASSTDGARPFHVATGYGHLNIVKYLLSEGCDIDACTANNLTPLHVAVLHGHLEIIKYLINKDAKTYLQNSDGETVFQCALGTQRLDIVKYLKSIGAYL